MPSFIAKVLATRRASKLEQKHHQNIMMIAGNDKHQANMQNFVGQRLRCETCGRNFNTHAAARHIPWCARRAASAKRQQQPSRAKLEALERYNWRVTYKPPLPKPRRLVTETNRMPNIGLIKPNKTLAGNGMSQTRRQASIDAISSSSTGASMMSTSSSTISSRTKCARLAANAPAARQPAIVRPLKRSISSTTLTKSHLVMNDTSSGKQQQHLPTTTTTTTVIPVKQTINSLQLRVKTPTALQVGLKRHALPSASQEGGTRHALARKDSGAQETVRTLLISVSERIEHLCARNEDLLTDLCEKFNALCEQQKKPNCCARNERNDMSVRSEHSSERSAKKEELRSRRRSVCASATINASSNNDSDASSL